MEYGSLLTLGTKRITITLPEGITPPDVAIGQNVVVPLVNVRYTLKDKQWYAQSRKLIIVIAIEDNSKAGLGEQSNVSNQSWEPNVRTSGGYVKQSVSYTPPPMRGTSPDLMLTTVDGVVVAIPVVLGAIAALIGLGLVYLTIDKIEDVVESPSVSIFIIAIAALIFFMLYKQLKS